MRNRNVLNKTLKQIRGKLTEQWDQIADYDLDNITDKRGELVKQVQKKYGYTRDIAEQTVDFILKKLNLRKSKRNNTLGIVVGILGSLLTMVILGTIVRRSTTIE